MEEYIKDYIHLLVREIEELIDSANPTIDSQHMDDGTILPSETLYLAWKNDFQNHVRNKTPHC